MQPKLLERAIAIAGSHYELCDLLQVEEHALRLWMSGQATLPERIFLAVVDLVLTDDIARASQDRRAEPRV
jgi:hypothetical protein